MNAAKPEISKLPTRSLLHWFRQKSRKLPWRENPTPYSVLVSEVMLQQTLVATVIPYFIRWMQIFPDLKSLAASSEKEVLRLWEGLGYYSRARNLHRTAQIVMTSFGGSIPSDYDDLRRLPGIGDYTASAILSIAYGKSYPMLDANVRRIVTRLLAVRRWDSKAEKQAREVVAGSLPRKAPGRLNEALMELGQTVCRPSQPLCSLCPLQRHCRGFTLGIANDIPTRRTSRPLRKESALLLILSHDSILLGKKSHGVMANLWVLPTIPWPRGGDKQIRKFLDTKFGKRWRITGILPPRTHRYTRYAEKLHPTLFQVTWNGAKIANGWKWVPLKDLNEFPLPSPYRSILVEALNLGK